MAAKVHSKDNFGIPATLGTQIPSTEMDVRPRIRRRVPDIQAPLVPDTSKSAVDRIGVRKASSLHTHSQTAGRKPSRTGSGRKVASQQSSEPCLQTQSHRTNPATQPATRPAQPESTDEGQDVRFIDVAGSGTNTSGRSSRMHTARETQTINPAHILEQCQEKDSDRVYEIDLHASGVGVIDHLEIFSKLRVLDLSCNHIRHIDSLHYNTDLRELKLYDNDIEHIENLERLKELCHLQLQHNRIKSIGKGLQGQRKLRTLRLDSNALCRIEVRDVASCSQLTSLDLSNNKLDSIAAVSCLTNLEELIVINNRLRTVADLSRCKKLQEVDLSYNKLSELSGLKGMSQLLIIHAPHNQISTLRTLGKLKGLHELNVAGNRLTDCKEVADLFQGLQILDLSDNLIEAWQSVGKLQSLPELVELYVSGNPFSCANGQKPSYHTDLHKAIPHLDILDGAHLKRAVTRGGAPVMRPLSAASILTARQVETQLKYLDDEMLSFEKNLSSQFESLRCTMNYLPTDGPVRSTSQTEGYSSPENRPTSKCGKRSRIKLAMEFAAGQD